MLGNSIGDVNSADARAKLLWFVTLGLDIYATPRVFAALFDSIFLYKSYLN